MSNGGSSISLVGALEAMKEEVTCAICLDTLQNAVEAECCRNLLCSQCEASLVDTSCPFCRRKNFRCSPNHPVRKIIERVESFLEVYSAEEKKRQIEFEERKREEERKTREAEARKKEEEIKKRVDEKRKKESRKGEADRKKLEEQRKKKEMWEKRRDEEEEKRREERGTKCIAFLHSKRPQFNYMVCYNLLKRFFFLEDNFLILNDNGECHWTEPVKGTLGGLLSERNEEIETLALTRNCKGEIVYYIKYRDGWSDWHGLPQKASDFLGKNDVVDVCLGMGRNYEVQYAIWSKREVIYRVEGVEKRVFERRKADFCSLGPDGEYFFRWGGEVVYSGVSGGETRSKVEKVEREGKLRELYFGRYGSLVARYSDD